MSEILKSTEYENNKPNEAYDEHLYELFSGIAAFQAYEYLNGDVSHRNEQKRLFLANETMNPELDYPSINQETSDTIEAALLSMKQDVIQNEQNEVVKQAYRWRLNEKIAEARMLKAVVTKDMRRFKRYSEFVYGKPSTDIFAYTINSIVSEIEPYIDSDDSTIKRVANELSQVLPYMGHQKIAELPDSGSIEYAHAQTMGELGDLIDINTDSTKFDADTIQKAFESALDQIGDTSWAVIIDKNTSKTAINVNQEKMQVNIPQGRTVGRDKLEALIVHEIGTHVSRRINGERSKLKLLGLGLDRYESGEEGISTMREQALSNKVDDFRGFDGHLAIGLSLGIDGTPRDFRQVYNIMEKYYMFKNLISKKKYPESEALEKAQTSAWNHTVRTFRGTDCKTPGVCFTKDIVYREGNIGIWELIKNNPDEMMRFNVGKYNPTNDRHLWILEQLGITDQDLSDLEN